MAPKIASRATRSVSAVLALLLLAGGARAQAPGDVERAQLLFGEARALLDDGRFPEACAKFAESQRLSPGGGTILNLGICRRREGRTATAFKVLTEALVRARADGRADRIATAERHLAELTPQLSRLTIELEPGVLASEVGVELDGELLDASVLGTAQPLDPGVHRLRAIQAGREAWTSEVTLGTSADVQRLTVPALRQSSPVPAPPVIAPRLASTPTREARLPAHPLPPPAQARSNALGYAMVSGGGVALAAGAYFGFRALSLRRQSDSHFNGKYCTQPSCVDDWNDAKRAATISTVALGMGIAALGVGGYLLLRPTANGAARPAMALYVGASPTNARVAARYDF